MQKITALSALLAKDLLALSGLPGARKITRRLNISYRFHCSDYLG